jgi:DNA-binding Lrp family transcriptional regulator
MNYTAEICSALLENRKLRLISAVADTVGISERECRNQVTGLCTDGTLKVDRDYLLIRDEAKAKRVAAGNAPAAPRATQAEAHVAAKMAANTAPAKLPSSSKAAEIKLPAVILVEDGIPIPPKRWGKVAGLNPFHDQFSTMKVGASFAIPVSPGVNARDLAEFMRKAASNFRRVMPEFRASIRTEVGEKTVRLWREPAPDEAETETEAPAPSTTRSSHGIRLSKDRRNGAAART